MLITNEGCFDAIPVFRDDRGKLMDYGPGVKLLRQNLGGITARALAELCGVSERTVNGWEQGRMPEVASLNKMSQLLRDRAVPMPPLAKSPPRSSEGRKR